MAKITKRIIDSLQAQGKDLVVWDGEMPGFGIRVKPSGVKSFCVQYRNEQGRSRRLTIGRYGRLTVEEARKEARQLLAKADVGQDPAEHKSEVRHSQTMADLVEEYLERHARPHKSPRSVKDDISIINQIILPRMGRKPVKEISRQEISKLHHELKDTPIRANRTIALLSKMFALAEDWGMRPENSNPCWGLKRYRENKRRRYLSGEELARLGGVLEKAEQEKNENPIVIAAIRMLIFSGMRLGEVLGLRWDYIDHEKGIINLPKSKTGAKTVPMNAPTRDLLVGLPRLADNPHVFPGANKGKPLVNINKPWRSLRAKAGLDDVRMHDLRHTFASVGAAAGMGLPIIGALLGHTQAATTQRYAHLSNDPLKAATEDVGRRIAEALNSDH